MKPRRERLHPTNRDFIFPQIPEDHESIKTLIFLFESAAELRFQKEIPGFINFISLRTDAAAAAALTQVHHI